MKPKTAERLDTGCLYHIYNRGINSCKIFVEEGNFEHFLRISSKHILPVADVYAWALMNNHFHFLIKVKEEEEIIRFQNEQKLRKMKVEDRVYQQFANYFNAYTKAYNRRNSRTGSLFEHPFQRKKILDEEYLKQVILYIHTNPVKHKVCKHPLEYPWTSYMDYISKDSSKVVIDKFSVLSTFSDMDTFRKMHDIMVELLLLDEMGGMSV